MATSGYADLRQIRRRLNLADTQTSADEKIQVYMREADNYVNIQFSIHATVPITNPDDELRSLSSALAASTYNYWVSPDKPDSGIKEYKERIQDHIKAVYGKYNASGLMANTVLKSSSKITGTE